MSEEEWFTWISDLLIYERDGAYVTRAKWAEHLFMEFIFPFLKRNKFQLAENPDKIIRKFLWFWRHLAMCGYDLADVLPNPCTSKVERALREYYDIFFHCLDSSVFDDLTELSAGEGALDDSYLGRRLLAELPCFLWSNIDLSNSKAFITHDNEMAKIEEAYKQLEEGDMSLEELDRRRMKNKGHDPDYAYDKHA